MARTAEGDSMTMLFVWVIGLGTGVIIMLCVNKWQQWGILNKLDNIRRRNNDWNPIGDNNPHDPRTVDRP